MRWQRSLLIHCLFLLVLFPAAVAPAAADWTRIGPDIGDVVEIAAAPSRPGVVYLGLKRGGVFRSSDRGRTWTAAGEGLMSNLALQDLDVDPADPSRVYAATNGGLFLTTDGGASWVLIGATELTGPFGGNVEQMEIHPRQPNVLLASVIGGPLFRSIDRGRTWTAEPGAPAGVESLAASPGRPGLFWAGLHTGGLLKSTDSGKTWETADRGLPAGANVHDIEVSPRAADTVYVSVGGLATGVFKSTNGGATWNPIGEGLGGAFVTELAVDAERPATLYAVVNGDLFRSQNGGAAWAKQVTTGLRGGLQTVKPLRYGVLAGTWAGLFQSRDQGATWRASLSGLTAAWIVGLALDTQDPMRIYAVDSIAGLYKSRNGGAPWLLLEDASAPSIYGTWTGPVAVDPADPETVYAGTPMSISKSDNGGRRWTQHPVSFCFRPTRIEIDPRLPSTLYASGGFLDPHCVFYPTPCLLHRSLDAGETWSCIRDGLPQPTGGALAGIDPFTSVVYALSYLDVWRSSDHGDTWTLVTADLNASAFVPSPVEEGTLWAGRRGEVGWSRDGGQTWTFSSTGLPADDGVIDLAFDPGDPAVLYAATRVHGVFRSADAGATWTPLGTWPADVQMFTGIELDPQDASVVYAATYGAGVLRYEP